MKVIIIEDEYNAAVLLEQMLKEIDASISIVDKCADLPSGVKSIRKHAPEVVFLDIELPVYSGIQLLEFFNPEEITFSIIFTTAYNEYALKAFEMSAVDYLVKPIQEEKISEALKKVHKTKSGTNPNLLPVLKENLEIRSQKKLVVPITDGYEILNLADIGYLQAEGSYTYIYFRTHVTKPLVVSKNLKHFEYIFSDNSDFMRIHRGYIVNINFAKRFVKNIGNLLVLEDKTELPVSDDKIKNLLDRLKTL